MVKTKDFSGFEIDQQENSLFNRTLNTDLLCLICNSNSLLYKLYLSHDLLKQYSDICDLYGGGSVEFTYKFLANDTLYFCKKMYYHILSDFFLLSSNVQP